MKTVLITGVGAIIGYGVVRSLTKTGKPLTLVGVDIYQDAVGKAWVDHFEQAPLTSSDGYLDWLEKTVSRYKVDLVIPGIEQDSQFFGANIDKLKALDAELVINNADLIELTQDKWVTYQELKRIGSDCAIDSYVEGSFAQLKDKLGLPFIVKPRKGYASKGIAKISCEADFYPLIDKLPTTYIAQPVVGHDDEEYTVGIFGDGSGSISASIILRRTLSIDGSTAKAWTCEPEGLRDCIKLLCAHFKPVGPTNLQFRYDPASQAWKLLEINPRISSSTSLRTAFGYNEADMCLRYYLDHEIIGQPQILQGQAARYIEDMVTYDSDNC